jgi:hypothetical protein
LKLDVTTLTAGERAWFVKREGGVLQWALVRPWEDGSAAVRMETNFYTFAPPAGPLEAVRSVESEGYVHLELARTLLHLAPDLQPPNW